MLMLSSITIGLSGALTEMQPESAASPATSTNPLPAVLVNSIRALCAGPARLVNLKHFIGVTRLLSAECALHRRDGLRASSRGLPGPPDGRSHDRSRRPAPGPGGPLYRRDRRSPGSW